MINMEGIFEVGDMITIESKTGNIRGVVVDVDPTFTRITMRENIWLASNILVEEPRHYYKSDISSLKVEYTKNELNKRNCENVSKRRSLNVNDYFHIQNVSKNYKFIDSDHGGQIRKAIKDLEMYDHIGLRGELSHVGLWATLHVLTLSTPNQIYIFDVLALAKLDLFRNILECKEITKIVYDCGAVVTALKSKYNISMSNVYDLLAVDLYISLKKEGKKFKTRPDYVDCVAKYLDSKDLIFRNKPQNPNMYSLRPLSKPQINMMAENVAHIHILSQKMDDILLKPYTDLCTKRLEESRL